MILSLGRKEENVFSKTNLCLSEKEDKIKDYKYGPIFVQHCHAWEFICFTKVLQRIANSSELMNFKNTDLVFEKRQVIWYLYAK